MHRISNTDFIVIDNTLLKSLVTDEEDIWFEEILSDEGILLKIHRFSEECR